MPKTIKFRNEELHLQFGRYKDTNMVALQLYDSNGFPYMTASFNPVEVPDGGNRGFKGRVTRPETGRIGRISSNNFSRINNK